MESLYLSSALLDPKNPSCILLSVGVPSYSSVLSFISCFMKFFISHYQFCFFSMFFSLLHAAPPCMVWMCVFVCICVYAWFYNVFVCIFCVFTACNMFTCVQNVYVPLCVCAIIHHCIYVCVSCMWFMFVVNGLLMCCVCIGMYVS